MKKTKKLNYINEKMSYFWNAKNHGHNGNNWWYPYPVAGQVAYNIKVYTGPKVDYNLFTAKQKEFYQNIDEMVNEQYYYVMNDELSFLIKEIEELEMVEAVYQAGRSGGWLEVKYRLPVSSEYDSVEDFEACEGDVSELYEDVKRLVELEARVLKMIEEGEKGFISYIQSDEFQKDLIINMKSDDEIKDYYKEKAKEFINKI